MQRFSKLFLFLVLIGFLLRVFINIWSLERPLNGDVVRYAQWARNAFIYGLSDGYTTIHFASGDKINQPPGTIYILDGMYILHLQASHLIVKVTRASFDSPIFLNDVLLPAILRLPSLFTDIFLTFLLYLLIKKYTNEKWAIIGSMLFYLNPALIYNGSVWGQMDSVNNFFFFLSLFLFLQKKYFVSLFIFFLCLYIKVSLLPTSVFFLFIFFMQVKFYRAFIFTCISLVVLILLTIPFSSNLFWLPRTILSISQGELSAITSGAFNFWWMITRPFDSQTLSSNTQFLFLHFDEWAYLIFTIFFIPIVYLAVTLKKKAMEPKNLFLLFSLVIVIMFLFLPKMHERYLYPLFPLLAAYCGLTRKFVGIFIILSLLHFINIFVIWQPGYFSWMPYLLIRDQNFRWIISIVMVVILLYVYVVSILEGTHLKTQKTNFL